jgi:flagellar protein FlbB
MAGYGVRIVGRVIILLILIAALTGGGIIWFDYLNIIDAKRVLAPVYRLIGLTPRSQEETGEGEILSLDAERLAVRLEALELRNLELDRREAGLQQRRGEIEQMAGELEDRQKALDEREKSINAQTEDAENKQRNVEQFARYLNGMPPAQAVGIITAMNDQDAIDVLRMTETIAQAEGTSSIVSYWLSLMPAERAAELQRKMAGRPSGLN